MKWLRSFGRHIRDAFRGFFRNGWLTVASIVTMAVALFIVGGFILLMGNVQKLTSDIEADIRILTYVDLLANEREEEALGQSIEDLPHVTTVTYRSKEEELDSLIATSGEEFDLFEMDANPLHNVYVVEIDAPDQIAEIADTIDALPHVERVNYGGLTADRILSGVDTVRYFIAVIAAILVVVAVLLVSNTIETTIRARSTEIEIMRLVGATNRFIRAPFSYEGLFIGLIGGGVASLLLYGLYEGMLSLLQDQLGVVNAIFLPVLPLFWYLTGGLVLAGMILGVIGAFRSTRKVFKEH